MASLQVPSSSDPIITTLKVDPAKLEEIIAMPEFAQAVAASNNETRHRGNPGGLVLLQDHLRSNASPPVLIKHSMSGVSLGRRRGMVIGSPKACTPALTPRWIRGRLYANSMHDIDMANSAPSLALQHFNRLGLQR
jgi:hypothetical protein